MFGSLGDQYAELWKAIIRPPRDVYDVRELGPSVFSVDHRAYQRSDMVLTNNRGMRLMCSHFEPVASERKAKRLPCCVYLHGNCSSRLEAISILAVVLPLQISVFAFDFAGSGLSDGEYVSLGHYERDDLQVVVEHLRNLGTVSSIALWGRSMGAVTALMHGDRDPSIAGMILDSPFSSLESLAQELVNVYVNVSIPTWMVSGALWMIKNSIKTKADFDIDELNPLEHVDKCFIPALFCSAYNDTFIKPAHTTRLYEKYAGDKNFLMIEGDHNSQRMKFFMDSAAIFLCATLRCEPLTESNLSEMVTPDMLHPDPTRLVPQPFKTSRGRVHFLCFVILFL